MTGTSLGIEEQAQQLLGSAAMDLPASPVPGHLANTPKSF